MTTDNEEELNHTDRIRELVKEHAFVYGEENLIELLYVLIFECAYESHEEYKKKVDLEKISIISKEVALYNWEAEKEDNDY